MGTWPTRLDRIASETPVYAVSAQLAPQRWVVWRSKADFEAGRKPAAIGFATSAEVAIACASAAFAGATKIASHYARPNYLRSFDAAKADAALQEVQRFETFVAPIRAAVQQADSPRGGNVVNLHSWLKGRSASAAV